MTDLPSQPLATNLASMLAPTIETERLILRHPASEDFEAFAAFAGDEEASRFLGGAVPRSLAWRAWCTLAGAWQIRGFSMFSVIEKSTGEWIGRVGPWMPEEWPGSEVGWGIAPRAQRMGYGREAAIAAIDYAFDHLDYQTVIHCIEPANKPSIALAQSIGSTLLRKDVPAPPPFLVRWDLYGQTREQWNARRAER